MQTFMITLWQPHLPCMARATQNKWLENCHLFFVWIWKPLGYNHLQNVITSEHSELLLTFLICSGTCQVKQLAYFRNISDRLNFSQKLLILWLVLKARFIFFLKKYVCCLNLGTLYPSQLKNGREIWGYRTFQMV